MDEAVDDFLESHSPNALHLLGIFSHNQAQAKAFCHDLISNRQLKIEDESHALFYRCFKQHLANDYSTKRKLYVVRYKGWQTISFADALRSLVATLLDGELYSAVENICQFPAYILSVCFAKPVMRHWFLSQLSEQCLEDTNLQQLRTQADLGFELFVNSVSDLKRTADELLHDTPNATLSAGFRRSKRLRDWSTVWNTPRLMLESFPARRAVQDHGFANELTIRQLLTFYSMTSNLVNALAGQNPCTDERVFNMRSAFPLVLAFVAESIDQQTLGRPLVRRYFAENAVVVRKLNELANSFKNKLIGGSLQNPAIDYGMHTYTQRAQQLSERYDAMFASKVRKPKLSWGRVRVRPEPVSRLLAEYDDALIFTGAAARVREFMHTHDRYAYFAYRFAPDVRASEVRKELLLMEAENCGDFISHYCIALTPGGGFALVTQPDIMLCMQTLGMLHMFVATYMDPLAVYRVLMRNLSHAAPATMPQLHDVSLFCAVQAMAFSLGGPIVRKNTVPPTHADFELYRFLPVVSTIFRDHAETVENLTNAFRIMLPCRHGYEITRNGGMAMLNLIGNSDTLDEKTKADLKARLEAKLQDKRGYANAWGYVKLGTCKNKLRVSLAEILRAICADRRNSADVIALFKQIRPNMSQKTWKQGFVGRSSAEGPAFAEIESYAEFRASALPGERTDRAYAELLLRGHFTPFKLKPVASDLRQLPHTVSTADNVEYQANFFRCKAFQAIFGNIMKRSEIDMRESDKLTDRLIRSDTPLYVNICIDKESVPLERSFFKQRIDVKREPMRATADDAARITDATILDLAEHYGYEVLATDRVTEQFDREKSYVECIERLHEMMEPL